MFTEMRKDSTPIDGGYGDVYGLGPNTPPAKTAAADESIDISQVNAAAMAAGAMVEMSRRAEEVDLGHHRFMSFVFKAC